MTKPFHWDNINSELKLIEVPRMNPEFKKVEAQFYQGQDVYENANTQIETVWRIQNNIVYDSYCFHKNMLKRIGVNDLNVQYLFHGTSPDTAEKIIQEGFDMRLNGKNGTVYGKGIYFATHSSYSATYSVADKHARKVMFLASVIVGRFALGNTNILKEPEGCQSTVDDLLNPSIYVVYHNQQAYPEYLISFIENPVDLRFRRTSNKQFAKYTVVDSIALHDIGLRVVLGPDYKSINKRHKNKKQGTVASLGPSPGWCTVDWDHGARTPHRCGAEGKYELSFATPSHLCRGCNCFCAFIQPCAVCMLEKATGRLLGLRTSNSMSTYFAGGTITVHWSASELTSNTIAVYLCSGKFVVQTFGAHVPTSTGLLTTSLSPFLIPGPEYFVMALSSTGAIFSPSFSIAEKIEVNSAILLDNTLCVRWSYTGSSTKSVSITLFKGSSFLRTLCPLHDASVKYYCQTLIDNPRLPEGIDYVIRVNSLDDQSVFGCSSYLSFPFQSLPARKIQAFYRGYTLRKKVRLETEKETRAIKIVQALWRGYRTRKVKISVTTLSHNDLTYFAALQHFQDAELVFAEKKRRHAVGAKTIQAFWRGYSTRKLQKYLMVFSDIDLAENSELYRFFPWYAKCLGAAEIQRKKLKAIKNLQALWRGRATRKLQLFMQHCSFADLSQESVLHAHWPKYSRCLSIAEMRKRSAKAAICIQAQYRGYKTRKMIQNSDFQKKKKATILLQRNARGYVTRKLQLHFQKFVPADLAPDSALHLYWPECSQHLAFAELRKRSHKASKKIQAVWRGHSTRAFQVLIKTYSCTDLSQIVANMRSPPLPSYSKYLLVVEMKKRSAVAIRIQSVWRGYSARKLECAMRSYLIADLAEDSHLHNFLPEYSNYLAFAETQKRRKFMATRLQAQYRGYTIRKKMHSCKVSAATTIQALGRGYVTRNLRLFMRTFSSDNLSQNSVFHAFWPKCSKPLAFAEMNRRSSAASKVITVAWRRHALRKKQLLVLAGCPPFISQYQTSAILIQARYRAYVRRKHQRKLDAAVTVQSCCRAFLCILLFFVSELFGQGKFFNCCNITESEL